LNYRIKGEESTTALLHNTIGGGGKLFLLEFIALGIEKPLSLLIVIALVTF
jgi:hypothetical protein